MSDSVNSTSSSLNDTARGYKVIHRAIDLLGFGIAMSVAWSCSSIIVGIVMFVITALVMALLAYAAKLMVLFNVDSARIETVGRTAGTVQARFTNVFTRKVPAPAAA